MATVEISSTLDGGAELAADATFLGAFGDDSYGGSPYGGAFALFGLESALQLSPTQVRVRYTAMFDVAFPSLLSISNYSLSPAATINSVILESSQSVLLNVSALTAPVYTITIADARGYFGQPLAPTLNSVQFPAIATAAPTFYAVATSARRVRAVFSEPMLSNAALTSTAQYVLTDLSGGPVLISSVTAEQTDPLNLRSTVLLLGEDLVDERHYRLTLLSGVVNPDHVPVSPDTSAFQWVANPLRTQIPVAQFSGEAMEGLFGVHAGLVFFSPALENPAPNSIIQVDEVDVCTRAYDEYHFPQPIDPRPFLTHGSGVAPTPTVTTLNSADWVLWAAFPRLVEARFDMTLGTTEAPLVDPVPPPTDIWTQWAVKEVWPPGRVALLNAIHWKLFKLDGTSASIDAVSVVGPATLVTVSGLSGMTPLDVGKILTIQGASTAANNGNFVIVAVISPSSVQIRNDNGVAPDGPNLGWAKPAHFITADNLTPFPLVHPGTIKVLYMPFPGGSTQEAEADLL